MDASPRESLAKKDVVSDLKAAVAARRELGDELEEPILEAFLARVQQRIDAQVAEQLARSAGKLPAGQRKSNLPGWVLPASLALSFPLVGVAGMYGGGVGIVAVLVTVVALTAIWLDYNSRH
jgi:hypothetical protein